MANSKNVFKIYNKEDGTYTYRLMAQAEIKVSEEFDVENDARDTKSICNQLRSLCIQELLENNDFEIKEIPEIA